MFSSVDVQSFTVKLILWEFGHVEGEVSLRAHRLIFSAHHSEPGEVNRCWIGNGCAGQSHRAAVLHRTGGLDWNWGVLRGIWKRKRWCLFVGNAHWATFKKCSWANVIVQFTYRRFCKSRRMPNLYNLAHLSTGTARVTFEAHNHKSSAVFHSLVPPGWNTSVMYLKGTLCKNVRFPRFGIPQGFWGAAPLS